MSATRFNVIKKITYYDYLCPM